MDKLTDAELVERVAMEVLKFESDWYALGTAFRRPARMGERKLVWWRPFSDMNDLQMIKDKFEYWEIRRDGNDNYRCAIFWDDDEGVSVVTAHTEARAVLEAALKAKGEKG